MTTDIDFSTDDWLTEAPATGNDHLAPRQPHRSLYDVMYKVFPVDEYVWGDVMFRGQNELNRPFLDVWDNEPAWVLYTLCSDLLAEQQKAGWKLTAKRFSLLTQKIYAEWEANST